MKQFKHYDFGYYSKFKSFIVTSALSFEKYIRSRFSSSALKIKIPTTVGYTVRRYLETE